MSSQELAATLTVGIAQTHNSTDIEANFSSIESLLARFEASSADVILFPECALSGFSAKIRECSPTVLEPFLDRVGLWSSRTGIDLLLPTAVAVDQKVFNSGYYFSRGQRRPFFKSGLTDSEKGFFSVPDDPGPKIFTLNGYRCALLICREAQLAPWSYFEPGQADCILWPGYWGWEINTAWGPIRDDQSPNVVFENMRSWKIPLIQSTFAANAFGDARTSGPEGLSSVIDQNNELVFQAAHKQIDAALVTLQKGETGTVIQSCARLD